MGAKDVEIRFHLLDSAVIDFGGFTHFFESMSDNYFRGVPTTSRIDGCFARLVICDLLINYEGI